MPARQPVRRKQRRPVRPPARPQPREAASTVAQADASPAGPTPSAVNRDPNSGRVVRQAPLSATRMALAARAAELARLDVVYLRHDLRNVALIAGLMLAIVIGLSFVLH